MFDFLLYIKMLHGSLEIVLISWIKNVRHWQSLSAPILSDLIFMDVF